jgi:hypothetical protein
MTAYVKKDGAWVEVADLQVLSGGSYRRALTGYVKNAGVWKQVYTYVPEMPTTTTVSVSNTTPTAPSTAVTISGSVLRTSDSSPVPTGSTVELWNGGVKLLTTTTNASGNYSFSWTPTTTGTYNLTVKFVENGFYTASQANAAAITAKVTTTASITVPGNTVINTNFTISGTLTSSTGEAVANGTVTVERSTDNINWTSAGTTTSASGAFSFTTLQWATPQQTIYWRAVYTATGNFLASTSTSKTVWFMRPTPGAVTTSATSMTHTGFTLNFSSSNATSYDVYKNGVRVVAGTTGTTYAVTGLTEDTASTWYVVALNENTTDGSTTSATKTYSTGHAAIIDSGTNVAFTFNAAETNSWRATDDWGYLGTDLAQGYFSSNPYTGVARFAYTDMRDAIDAYGTDRAGRWNQTSCSKIEVYLTRQTGSGSAAAVPISWYMSTTNPGNTNAEPNRTYGPDIASPSGLATGDSGWLTLPDDTWGNKLLDGTYISLAMYHNGSANYSQYNGGTGFKVRLTLSWNYTFRALVSPTFA